MLVFLNEYLKDNLKSINIYTHLIDLGRTTKVGTKKFKLIIYDLKNHEKIDEKEAIQLISKKGFPYFKVLINEKKNL